MRESNPFGSTRRLPHHGGWAYRVELSGLRLHITSGPDQGTQRTFILPTIRIGTSPENDLTLTDDSVSGFHASVTSSPDGVVLTDQKSTNGTFVQGVRASRVFLVPWSEFVVGQTAIRLEPATEEYFAVPAQEDRLGPLVGPSHPMREVYAVLRAVADSPATVLVQGESGTGKELVAQALHELSGRPAPLVVFDCASSSPDLIRSELFGHTAGAFTGAQLARQGAFRKAHRGTLFIDELGELPSSLQGTLLRVLESREVKPLGSDAATPIDVRLVAATNRDLERMVREGQFRQDLFHRLAVIRVRLPALRDRPEDIPLLFQHFAAMHAPPVRITSEALRALQGHAWPGNVRELKNTVDRLAAVFRGKEVSTPELGLCPVPPAGSKPQPVPGPPQGGVDRKAVLEALEGAQGNKALAARRLGIGLSTLKRRLKDDGGSAGE